MIAFLRGSLFRKTTQSIIIDAGGIGYEVFIPLSTYYSLPETEEKVSLHIYTHVRDDALLLFGFQTTLEKDLFLMLISVSGIGPKLALNILSGIGPQELIEAIASEDSVRMQAIPGIGKKTSERISLELKDRALKAIGDQEVSVPALAKGQENLIMDDALSALINLGYSARSGTMAIKKVQSLRSDIRLEELIREALKILS
ncbi:MAG: Holliday junction branch migration protein RuvA [Desulfobacteraceae bacterium 4484_190.1]|nr:MAG: Holliday junction branch migration protein RuvA [Desulfobacteraceae bacterium 4484_190.1]